MGSGRACYGMLTITRRDIAWTTPFSRCRRSPYRVIERGGDGEETRMVYQLTRSSETCRYRVLVLTHRAASGADIGWNVVGYPSLDSAAQHRREDELACYLYRPTTGK